MFEKRGDSFTVSYSKLQNSRPKRRGGQSAQGKAEDAGGLAPAKDDNAAMRTLYPRSFAGYSDDCYRYAGYNSGSLSTGPPIRIQLYPLPARAVLGVGDLNSLGLQFIPDAVGFGEVLRLLRLGALKDQRVNGGIALAGDGDAAGG